MKNSGCVGHGTYKWLENCVIFDILLILLSPKTLLISDWSYIFYFAIDSVFYLSFGDTYLLDELIFGDDDRCIKIQIFILYLYVNFTIHNN